MSKIEWTEQTWNPIVGCRRVSSGCDNCYAILEAHRKTTLFQHYAGVTSKEGGRLDWSGKFNVAPDHIFEKPLRVSAPTTWFVNSMSDLFGEGVSDETIKRVFDIMNRTPQHRYQVLTKRPNRAVKLASQLEWTANIWFGVSIEENKFVGRADLLRKVPAAVRFISAEPLLSGLPDLDLTDIDWLIVGGESGRSSKKVRPMSIEWVRDLLDKARFSKTAFFFKQWGNWNAAGEWCRAKADAGRKLDGRTYDEMPGEGELGWSSVGEFRLHLAHEHGCEVEAPTIDGQSPRVALREPIWRTLQTEGPMDGKTLRHRMLASAVESPRMVNFHAWALVDLQKAGWVESFVGEVVGKRGRAKQVKLYRALKPRIRVLAREAV